MARVLGEGTLVLKEVGRRVGLLWAVGGGLF